MLGKRKVANAGGARRSDRRKIVFGGRVVHSDGSRSFDCVIHDFSKAGAKIEIRESDIVPKTFFLLGSREWVAYEAELVWRKGTFAGARFQCAHDLAGSVDPRMQKIMYLGASLMSTRPGR